MKNAKIELNQNYGILNEYAGKVTSSLLIVSVCLLILLVFGACSKDDPCDDIVCLNGGQLIDNIDCTCECAFGYEGENCEIEKEILKMKLTSVKVLDFPAFKPFGDVWDPFANTNLTPPDIKVLLERYTGFLLEVTNVKSNANSSNDYILEVQPEPGRGIDYPGDIHVIRLLDYDLNTPIHIESGEEMDRIEFIPHEVGKGFSETMIIHGSKSSIQLTFEYDFYN